MTTRAQRWADTLAAPPLRHERAVTMRPLSECDALRRLSAAQVEWARRLASGVTVALGRVQAGSGDGAPQAVGSVELRRFDAARWRESRLWPQVHVCISGTSVPMRLAPDRRWNELSDPALQRLDGELRNAIGAHLSADVREGLGVALHAAGLVAAPTVVPIDEQATGEDAAAAAPPDDAGPCLVLTLRMHLPRHEPSADAAEPPAGPWDAWLRLGPDLLAPPPAPPADDATHFDPPLPLSVLVARAALPAHELVRLAPGHVVLLDRVGPEGDVMQAWLTTGRECIARLFVADCELPSHAAPAPARRADARPTITFARWATLLERQVHARTSGTLDLGTRRHRMDFPDFSTSAAGSSDKAAAARGPDPLADVTLDVQAVVDLAPARISELRRWTPGMVLGASAPVDGTQVALRVSGHVVGRGRLVAVDSLLALELLELYD